MFQLQIKPMVNCYVETDWGFDKTAPSFFAHPLTPLREQQIQGQGTV